MANSIDEREPLARGWSLITWVVNELYCFTRQGWSSSLLFSAASTLGFVAVPVYPPRRNRSLERIQAIADDAEAKVALTTDPVLERVEKLIDETPHLKELTWLATSRLEDETAEGWEMPDIRSDTLAFLQYTSGSTGTPKGVMLDHANLVHNSALISFGFEHSRSGTGVYWLPSYHDMGLIGGILQPLYVGRPNVFMSPMSLSTKTVTVASGDYQVQGDDQRRSQFRLRSLRAKDHRRTDRTTGSQHVGSRVQWCGACSSGDN